MSGCVNWLGLSSVYTQDERQIMAALPFKEQTVLHVLKAFTDGEISQDPGAAERLVRSRSPSTEGEPAPLAGDPMSGRDTHNTGAVIPSDKRLPAAVTGVSLEHPPSAPYTNPEDIPFGKEPSRAKRRPKIYAVAWTWRKHRIVKTKKRGTEVLKVWKRWHERQGYDVKKSGEGYTAYPPDFDWTIPPIRQVEAGVRSISLHEYDKETKQRI